MFFDLFMFRFLLIYNEDRYVALTAQSAVNATWRVRKIVRNTALYTEALGLTNNAKAGPNQ